MTSSLANFTDVLNDVVEDSQPLSFASDDCIHDRIRVGNNSGSEESFPISNIIKPRKGTGQHGQYRSVEEIDPKYRGVFTYPLFNLVQSKVIEDALYSDKSMVICAPTGSGKTVVFEMAIVQLLMEMEDSKDVKDYKIIYMAPVKALCTERLTEWSPKFTRLGLLCIEVTGDTDVDFSQLKPYRIIITTPEKWDMLTRRWRDHRGLVNMIKLFLIDEVHILNDITRGPVLEAVVSRMKTIESAAQSAHRIEQLQSEYQGTEFTDIPAPPKIRFVAASATVNNPEDVANWLGNPERPAVFYKFGEECRPVKLKKIVEGYPCPDGMSIFKFDIVLNYKISPIIRKYHNGKPTLIFCNTRKSVLFTAETLSKELTINFEPQQKAKLAALASSIKNKKLQTLLLNGIGCHHAGLLFEERTKIENAFRNRDLPILITTTTLAMGVNLPAHLVIIKNTQQYVNGAYQEYSISTILQMVGRAGRPQFDTEATAVIMTTLKDKPRYQALVEGSEPLQSYLHTRLAENLNCEAALGTIDDVAQCVQWLRSTFLYVRAGRDPKRYLGLPPAAPHELISKKIEELCVRAMNGLASSGMITMDETCSIQSTAAGRLMSSYYLDLGTMKNIMKITGSETLEELLLILCECHELADMHLRMDERRLLNTLNRNNNAATIRFPMKGKITTRQMKVNCIIQAVLGCLPIPDPSLNQEAMKIMRIADRICKCLVAYVTYPELTSSQSKSFSTVLNSLILAKCVSAQLWENSPYVSKQLKGIGPTFSNLLATAGKVNFMLLEESHPRDLERIINKGPPMGNVLHKLFTLLPKYQLSTTPIDQNLVAVQLLLLNQAYLSENLDELTAGDAHKCYIVIGDSENFLHHLSSFRDKDLISIYDGSITYQITRKHNFEHKMFVHCISASFVGIDVKCEYLFRSLEPQTLHTDISTSVSNTNKKVAKKQTTILDTFKERKRKSNDDISQTKEKKKRNTTIMKKFQNLKDSFSVSSKQLNDELYKTTEMSNEIIDTYMETNPNISTLYNNQQSLENIAQDTATESILLDNDLDTVELSDDNLYDINNIESIMEEIENEISRSSNKNNEYKTDEIPSKTITSNNKNLKCNTDLYFKANPRDNLRKNINKFNKTNYNFIELLEKNIDLDSDNENSPTVKNSTGFSDAVRNKIENYLKTNFNNTNPADKLVEELIHEGETDLPGVCLEQSAKESKGDCHFTDNDSKEKILTPEINDSNDIKMQNVNNYSSEKTVTESSRHTILPYNRLDVITEKKLDVKNKEDEINEYQYDATNTDNLLIEDILEDYDSNIPGTKSIEQIQNSFSKNVLMLHNSNNTHAQNKELLSADSIRNLQLSNKETADIAYENPISKGIIIPSKERNVSCPYTHKVDYLPSKSFYPVKSNSDNQTIKYTYSRTNINYTTKNMPDHIIRVKRKLQVDVIAEILPIQEAAREAKILKTNETANNEKYKIVTNLQNDERVIKCIDKKTTPSNSLEGKKCNVKNELYENINELREKEAAEDQKINRNNKENIINEDNNAEPSSVAQILQKHFNVFRMKSEPINRNQTSVKIHDGDKPALPSAVKQKRPFKINQIRDIHIPLPETLIENSGTPSQSIGEFKGIKLHERTNQKQIIKPQNISSNIILPPTDITPVKVGNLSPEFKTPTKLDLETGDHVLDQSMFDPKILLQSMNVTADEDIIPPPHEFRDNFEPDTPHENFQSMYYNVDSLDHINNTCVNSKNIDPNIKEIENWTLSRNSSVWSLANNTITEPLNNNQWPCAMPQEITSTVKNLTLPCVPRRHKLAQFNFSQKEKLKK